MLDEGDPTTWHFSELQELAATEQRTLYCDKHEFRTNSSTETTQICNPLVSTEYPLKQKLLTILQTSSMLFQFALLLMHRVRAENLTF